jgi:hypothetical protein
LFRWDSRPLGGNYSYFVAGWGYFGIASGRRTPQTNLQLKLLILYLLFVLTKHTLHFKFVVTMKTIFWEVMSCNPVEYHRSHEGYTAAIFRFQEQADTFFSLSTCSAYYSTLKLRLYAPPKCRWNTAILYGVTLQKIVVLTEYILCKWRKVNGPLFTSFLRIRELPNYQPYLQNINSWYSAVKWVNAIKSEMVNLFLCLIN